MKTKVNQKNLCVVCKKLNNVAGIRSPYGTHICMDCADSIMETWSKFHEEHLDHCDCYLAHIRNRWMNKNKI